MDLVQSAASKLVPGIQFTSDLLARYETGKVPMLDLQVWTEPTANGQGTRIWHTFCEKSVTSPLVFHSGGACSMKQKIITLAEETKRRLYNQDTAHTVEERMKDLDIFIQKLADSGY